MPPIEMRSAAAAGAMVSRSTPMQDHDQHDRPGGLFSLTQIRHLMRVEFARAQRYRYPLVALAVGVDNLRRIRETAGYGFTEHVLGELARQLETHTRVCDHLGRLVDDKLVAVLPHTDEQGARTLAERLVEQARELRFDGAKGPERVTVSAGLCCFQAENALFFDALLDGARSALDAAAAAGGDRVAELGPGGSA